MKKTVLTAINAKYIHSNLAVYSLRAYAARYADCIELAEFTINQQKDYILQEIYRKKPDILAFSCYIWNMEYVLDIMENVHLVLPDVQIWLGGPEVSFDCRERMEAHPEITGIMRGEGEKIFLQLMEYYQEQKGSLAEIAGLVYRDGGSIIENRMPGSDELMDMDEIPFVYGQIEEFTNKIIYYETSRGCPFRCSYCLSSIDKRVRFRSEALVEKELQFFLDHCVPQVKFVDRTFNCSHAHAMKIWNYILEHDNGKTNFHFEIEADILQDDEMKLLARMRPGLVQLEIGVQSTNPQTLEAVHRNTDFGRIAEVSRRILTAGNIHLHLDLIAGLPYEDYTSFRESFCDVYSLHPHELQLGFLKVLRGSGIRQEADRYGIVSRKRPVYEVLSTHWLDFDSILKLKGVEDMLEIYYNSGQFVHTVRALERLYDKPFDLYEELADCYSERGWSELSLSRAQRLDALRQFAHRKDPGQADWYDETLLMDLYLRENAKTRPQWAPDLSEYRDQTAEFYRREETERRWLEGYREYHWKQLMKMTHLEHFTRNPENGDQEESWMLFDYSRRDPLTKDARTIRLEHV